MRSWIIVLCLSAAWCTIARAEETIYEKPEFRHNVKASLRFAEDCNRSPRYPRVLRVYLRLENVHDAAVNWVANSIAGIDAELLDRNGKPVRTPPQAASIQSNDLPLTLPFGSRLDWLISHGGVSIPEDAKDKYALFVGSKGWLIPKDSLSEYSLRIQLRGVPWRSERREQLADKLLIEIPPTQIELPET
jgi:hypothetical protein